MAWQPFETLSMIVGLRLHHMRAGLRWEGWSDSGVSGDSVCRLFFPCIQAVILSMSVILAHKCHCIVSAPCHFQFGVHSCLFHEHLFNGHFALVAWQVGIAGFSKGALGAALAFGMDRQVLARGTCIG